MPASFMKDWEWFVQTINTLILSGNKYAEVRSIAVRLSSSNDWQNYATRLYIPSSSPSNSTANSKSQILDRLALLRKEIHLETLTSYENLVNIGASWEGLTFPQTVQASTGDFQTFFYGSHNTYGALPLWSFEFGKRPDSSPPQPAGPFLHPEFPFYESVAEAAADWLEDQSLVHDSYPPYSNRCLLKSSKAVIKGIRNEEDSQLIIDVEPIDNLDELHITLAARHPNGTVRLDQKAAPRTTFNVPPELQALTIYLIDKRGEPQDYFSENSFNSSWPDPVIGSNSAKLQKNLIDQIRQGEGTSLEFKKWMPVKPNDEKRKELLQTVVAFANTKGGTILVGIDDYGEIVGIERNLFKDYSNEIERTPEKLLDQYQKEIRQVISNEIEPEVDIRFEKLKSGDQTTLAIQVKGNKALPYSIIRSNDIYVRHGANNMKATPEELKQLINPRALF